MIINSPFISGSLTTTGAAVISGSLTVLGPINGAVTGSVNSASFATNANFLDNLDSTSFVFTSSYNVASSSLSTRTTNLESTASVLTTASASFAVVSSSFASTSGSLSTRTTNLESTALVLTTASASFAVVSSSFASTSGSLSTRTTNLESTASVLTTTSASFATTSGSLSTRVTTLENASSSFAQQSGSNSTRLANLETTSSVLTTASASFAVVSASFSSTSQSMASRIQIVETSYATTGSNIFTQNQTICGNLTTTGTITAQTINVQQVTSSIVYSSGSNIFGNQLTNTQQFTGSVFITGSTLTVTGGTICATGNSCVGGMSIVGSCLGIGTISPGAPLEVYSSNTFNTSTGANSHLILNYNSNTAGGPAIKFTRVGVSDWTAIQTDLSGGTRTLKFIQTNSGVASTQMVISANDGNVGIGTTSPSATLDVGSAKTLSGTDPISVYTDTKVQSAVTGGLIGYNVRMVGLSPAAGSYTIANMYAIKTNTPAIQPNVTVTNSYGLYIGRTDDPTSGGVVTNKYALVTEAAAGNVGIGTASPSDKLSVTDASTYTFNIGAAAGGAGAVLYTLGSAALTFATCGSSNERMRITSGGNVGIGTTSPTLANLQVNGSANNVIGFFGASGMTANQSVFLQVGKNQNTNNNAGEISFKYVADDDASNMVSLGFYGNGQKLNILKSGNVGIGLTSPSFLLDIKCNTVGENVTVANFSACNYNCGCATYIQIGGPYSGGDGSSRIGSISPVSNCSHLIFETHTSTSGVWCEIMRITSGGNVGIGTTNPLYILDICNNNSSETTLKVKNSSATGAARIVLNAEGAGAGSSGDGLIFFDMNSTAWVMGVDKSDSSKFKIANDVYGDFTGCNYLTINTNGIACFACTICAPSALITNNIIIGTTYGTTAQFSFGSTTGAQTTANLTDAGVRCGILEVLATGGAAGNGGALVLGSDTWGTGAGKGQIALKALLINGSGCGTSDLAFSLRNNPSCSNLTERMRITVDGSVLVGTTNSDIGGSVTGISLTCDGRVLASISHTGGLCHIFMGDRRCNEGPVYSFWRGGFFKSAIGVLGTAGIANDGGITFSTVCGNDTICERMRITCGGNVGIGTSSPSQLLEVVGGEIKAGRVDSSSEGGQVSFGRASDNATGWYIDVYGSTSTPSLRFVDVSSSAVRMTIDGSGITCFACQVCTPTIIATEARFGNSYTCSFNVCCTSGTYATVIPPNTLTSLAVYLAHIYYDNGTASPYTANTAFIFKTTNTNGGSSDNAYFPMTSTHQGGTGCWSFRSIAGSGQVSSGLQIQAHSFANPTSNATLYLTRLA